MGVLEDSTNSIGVQPLAGTKKKTEMSAPAADEARIADVTNNPATVKRKLTEAVADRNVKPRTSSVISRLTAGRPSTSRQSISRATSSGRQSLVPQIGAGGRQSMAPSLATTRRQSMATQPTTRPFQFAASRQRGSVRTATAAAPKAAPVSQNRPARAAAGGPAKRQPWDTKGRLADMEEKVESMAADQALAQADNARLREDMADYQRQIEDLRKERLALQSTVQTKDQEYSQSNVRVAQLEADMAKERQAHIQELTTAQANHGAQLSKLQLLNQTITSELDQFKQEKQTLTMQLTGKVSEIECLTMLNSEMTSRLTATECQLDVAKRLGEERLKAMETLQGDMDRQGRTMQAEIDQLKATVETLKGEVAEREQRLREAETTRRKLHNTIQELRGNVRVFCRVRPQLADEVGADTCVELADNDRSFIRLTAPGEASSLGKTQVKNYEFKFDYVFPPTASQETVFSEISQLVQSALDGYSVCVFAYGQTGSGKTYTMEGPQPIATASEDALGMIPRAISQIFKAAAELKEKQWEYSFEATFLEIYNESLHDLLQSRQTKKLDVKMKKGSANDTYVPDLTVMPVETPEAVHQLLVKACANRATAATNCNIQSSRSHSVFRLHISGHNANTQERVASILNLIDLAGSERLSQSGSTGDRLQETKAINKSLTNLGSVIQALANREAHVPFRNSKLTQLLQPCLGGNSKTLMFVNVNSRQDCVGETVNSLRFAAKVNECDIGTARKTVK